MSPSSRFDLARKALRLVRSRPTHLYQAVRCYGLFRLTYALRRLLPIAGVEFGRNVRLQRLSSVMAEHPTASILLGDDAVVYESCKLEAYGGGKITVGAGSILGGIRAVSRYDITIGERCLASWNIFIQDFDPHPVDPAERAEQVREMALNFRPRLEGPAESAPRSKWAFPGDSISIGKDVWIGANATILKGAHIGDGSIVATGAVVLRGVYPAGSVLAGNPAKVVKRISADPDYADSTRTAGAIGEAPASEPKSAALTMS